MKTAATACWARQTNEYNLYPEIRLKNIRNITGGILVPFYLVIYLLCFMRRGPGQKLLTTIHCKFCTSFISISYTFIKGTFSENIL